MFDKAEDEEVEDIEAEDTEAEEIEVLVTPDDSTNYILYI